MRPDYTVGPNSSSVLCAIGIMGHWSIGTVGYWYYGTSVLWAIGTVGHRYQWPLAVNFGTICQWSIGTVGHRYYGPLVLWSTSTMDSGPSVQCTTALQYHYRTITVPLQYDKVPVQGQY